MLGFYSTESLSNVVHHFLPRYETGVLMSFLIINILERKNGKNPWLADWTWCGVDLMMVLTC